MDLKSKLGLLGGVLLIVGCLSPLLVSEITVEGSETTVRYLSAIDLWNINAGDFGSYSELGFGMIALLLGIITIILILFKKENITKYTFLIFGIISIAILSFYNGYVNELTELMIHLTPGAEVPGPAITSLTTRGYGLYLAFLGAITTLVAGIISFRRKK